jgi:type III restriction enzyme
MSWLPFDPVLISEISARMDLRKPNADALTRVAKHIEDGDGREVVCDLATGVGKTYLAAGLVDYLATQGVRNVLIVTPGSTIQDKTVGNFTPGHPKYVPGAEQEPLLITVENYSRGQVGDALHNPDVLKLFVFNVQQLIKPTVKTSRKTRQVDEFIGQPLYDHLREVDDLIVIADEHHVYRSAAKAFNAAITDLGPRALVGLTATPDKADLDKVIYRYSLADAIADGLVKVPVIAYREDGIKDIDTQLADACQLRERKEAVWRAWATQNKQAVVSPVLFVVCQEIRDADRVAGILAGPNYLPGNEQVLVITSQSSDAALTQLAAVESPESPVRAVVSVDKLKEGWDVKNIGVIVGYRALASETLTEQVLGRGLRLPFGKRVGVPAIDQVDLVAHDSYKKLLADKKALLERVMPVDPTGGAAAVPTGGAAAVGQPKSAGDPSLPFAEPQAGSEGVAENEDQGVLHLVGPARMINGELQDGEDFLQIASLDAINAQHDRDRATVNKVLYKVKDAPSIKFPRREREVVPVEFSLSYVDNAAAQAEGAGFTHEFPVHIKRQALMAHRTVTGETVVQVQQVQEEAATQRYMPVADVRGDFVERILDLGLVASTTRELTAAERIAEQFLLGAEVVGDENEADWSERRASQAVSAISALIRTSYNNRRLNPRWAFRTVEAPIRQPMPTDTGDKWDNYVKNRWFGGWKHNIQQAASFQAKSTEWVLAHMFDASDTVQWWLRLYDPGDVWIERDNGRKYYPDFIVLDNDGVHWIVEGKSDREARDVDVLEKKRAAEEWGQFVRDEIKFGVWRYMFVTETHLRSAATWEELLVRTKPSL